MFKVCFSEKQFAPKQQTLLHVEGKNDAESVETKASLVQ